MVIEVFRSSGGRKVHFSQLRGISWSRRLVVGGWWLAIAMAMAAITTTPPRGITQVNPARIQTHLASEITFIKYTKTNVLNWKV